MTEKETLLHHIATLKSSINRDWSDLTGPSALNHDEHTVIKAHIEQCVQDLNSLYERLDRLPPPSN